MENKVTEAKHKQMLQHLESLKQNVKMNPIEQMEAVYIDKQSRLNKFKQAIINLNASVDKQQRKLKQIKKDKPHYDMSDEEAQTVKMVTYVKLKEEQYNNALQTLTQFKDTIDQVKVKWEFQLEANEAIRAMNSTDKDSMMQELLTETAFEEVHQSFDKVFSQMEIELNSINVNLLPNAKFTEDIITAEVSYERAN